MNEQGWRNGERMMRVGEEERGEQEDGGRRR